jgi:hypothetical protein
MGPQIAREISGFGSGGTKKGTACHQLMLTGSQDVRKQRVRAPRERDWSGVRLAGWGGVAHEREYNFTPHPGGIEPSCSVW